MQFKPAINPVYGSETAFNKPMILDLSPRTFVKYALNLVVQAVFLVYKDWVSVLIEDILVFILVKNVKSYPNEVLIAAKLLQLPEIASYLASKVAAASNYPTVKQ